MATVGQQLTQPETGWRRYDETHPYLIYGGSHSLYTHASNSGGTARYILKGTIQFNFIGSKLRVISFAYPTRSNKIKITIDGTEYFYSEDRNPQLFQMLSFHVDGLEFKEHSVIISNIDSTNTGGMCFDAIDIDASGQLIPLKYFENTNVNESLRKYSVAWFHFDEESGNVLDKLGSNYVGTIASATRVEGWNGEGSAISFNGNANVQFNNVVIPLGEKTIRFKVKLNSFATNGVIFTTATSWSTTSGLMFHDDGNGYGYFYIFDASGSYVFDNRNNLINLSDMMWHEIHYVQYSNRKAQIYVDGKLILTSMLLRAEKAYSKNLNLGGFTANQRSKSQIDDFQVYSKAIPPSDFPQKKLVIKTQNNNVITLPNKQGRVKEIQSANESDLINQGYTWLDADNALDKDGIKLTHSTTEYEVVGKTNSSVGNGKMFTLPISNFKTVKVENNN